MPLVHREATTAGEPRYDTEMLRKVVALAGRLQSTHQAAMSAQEIEAIGAEVGLESAYIQHALALLVAHQSAGRPPLSPDPEEPGVFAKHLIRLGRLQGALLLTYTALHVAFAIFLEGSHPGLSHLWQNYLEFPLVLFGLLGLSHVTSRGISVLLQYARQIPRMVSREALIDLLFSLQQHLERQKRHCAFLSIDVVGSSQMKRSAPELAVEYSFGQFRRWVEDVVRVHGGEMQSAAGDGVMALFPTDAGALRAARQLQEALPQFNEAQNRLPQPFCIRCDVSAGEVAIEEGMPLGHLQSPVIDRAAALQKLAEPGDIVVSGELSGPALIEMGVLKPLAEPAAGEPAFSWRGALPGISSPGTSLPRGTAQATSEIEGRSSAP